MVEQAQPIFIPKEELLIPNGPVLASNGYRSFPFLTDDEAVRFAGLHPVIDWEVSFKLPFDMYAMIDGGGKGVINMRDRIISDISPNRESYKAFQSEQDRIFTISFYTLEIDAFSGFFIYVDQGLEIPTYSLPLVSVRIPFGHDLDSEQLVDKYRILRDMVGETLESLINKNAKR